MHSPALRVSTTVFSQSGRRGGPGSGHGGAYLIVPRQVKAQPKTLKILQWKHFVPGYDTWFNDTYVKTWGAQHDTRVIVDNIGLADLHDHAAAEIKAQRGTIWSCSSRPRQYMKTR